MAETFINAIDLNPKVLQRLEPGKKSSESIPRGYGKKQVEERWKWLLTKNEQYNKQMKEYEKKGIQRPFKSIREELCPNEVLERTEIYRDNIENFVGTVQIPLGIAGPLRVNGLHAKGTYYIPLATTEAALVASVNRGISCINQAGGISSAVIKEGVNRDPVIIFDNLIEVGKFLQWAYKNFENFKKAAETSTRHGKLQKIEYTTEGNCVHMRCIYSTGDASGQNMVTIATEKMLEYIAKHCPVKYQEMLVEGGMSGDKKGNHSIMNSVRGRRVVAEVKIPANVVTTTLHVTPEQIVHNAAIGIRALAMTGVLGITAHWSNPITAMSIALGQDPACASESHVGISRSELTKNGDLYMSVTIPNLLVGTVGGGTKLPHQRACLELMGLYGSGKANALAEVFAGVIIAAELSLGAAIVSGDFTKAHKLLARDTSAPINLEKDSIDEAFEKAQAKIVKLAEPPSVDVIMEIYGLYKQATCGNINIPKPGMLAGLKVKKKYSAWKAKYGMSQEQAKREYTKLVLSLTEKETKK